MLKIRPWQYGCIDMALSTRFSHFKSQSNISMSPLFPIVCLSSINSLGSNFRLEWPCSISSLTSSFETERIVSPVLRPSTQRSTTTSEISFHSLPPAQQARPLQILVPALRRQPDQRRNRQHSRHISHRFPHGSPTQPARPKRTELLAALQHTTDQRLLELGRVHRTHIRRNELL